MRSTKTKQRERSVMFRSNHLIAAIVVVSMSAGCGSDRPDLHTVTGEVLFQGVPLTEAQIMFMPNGARAAQATTDAKGRFELMTYDPIDGAVAGEHQVTIAKMIQVHPNDTSSYPVKRSAIPGRYGNPTTSGLMAMVADGEENHFRFELTP